MKINSVFGEIRTNRIYCIITIEIRTRYLSWERLTLKEHKGQIGKLEKLLPESLLFVRYFKSDNMWEKESDMWWTLFDSITKAAREVVGEFDDGEGDLGEL